MGRRVILLTKQSHRVVFFQSMSFRLLFFHYKLLIFKLHSLNSIKCAEHFLIFIYSLFIYSHVAKAKQERKFS